MKYHYFLKRSIAFMLAFSLTTQPLLTAYAARDGDKGKEEYSNNVVVIAVPSAGVRSVNDLTTSDYKVPVTDLEKTYKHFDKEDGLTEYFFSDNKEKKIENLPDYIAWLIEHDILNRDDKVTITYSDHRKFPNITLEKDNLEVNMFDQATKTDFLILLYKSIFGSIQSRAVGVKTDSYRIDKEGELKLYDKKSFDYKPQGDYVKKNYLNKRSLEVNHYFNLTGGDGGSGGMGGSGGSGGDANADIHVNGIIDTYEFQPIGDTLLYYTNDVLELYMSAMLNKGLLSNEDNLKQTFLEEHNKSTLSNGVASYPLWDSRLYPQLFMGELPKRTAIEELSIGSGPLGKGYKVSSSGSSLTIDKQDIGSEARSMFNDESSLTRMDVYKYIYKFLQSSEKVLSELEASIVSYKYSARFENSVLPEDIKVLQYLTAKGILNFDSNEDYLNLYTSLSWKDVYQLLYRVANKEARYDFSKIQLTDSDKYWQAKGFSSQPINLYEDQPDFDVMPLKSLNNTSDTVRVASVHMGGILTSYDVTLLAEDTFLSEVRTDDFRSLEYNKINFDPSILLLSDDTLNSLVYESIAISAGTNLTGFSEDTKKGINAAKYSGYNLKWWDDTNFKTTAEYVLNNAFIALSYAEVAPDADVQEKLKKICSSKFNWSSINNSQVSNKDASKKLILEGSGRVDNIFSRPDSSRYEFIMKQVKTITVMDVSAGNELYKIERSVSKETNEIENTANCIRGIKAENKKAAQSKATAATSASKNTATEAVLNAQTYTGTGAQENQKQTYVSFRELQKVYPKIVKISDSILKNTATGSYAYFNLEQNVALVGTAVIQTNGESVIKKDDELYYDWNVIYRLFPAATSRELNVGNALYYSESLIQSEYNNMPIYGDDMLNRTTASVMNVVTTLNNLPSTEPQIGENEIGKPDLTHAGHDLFVSLSSIDCNANIIYRVLSNASKEYAIAILQFDPDDSEDLNVEIPANPTLEDMMGTLAKRPTAGTGKDRWDRNIELGNLYANWLYGTQDKEYVKTGIIKPSLTIITLPDSEEHSNNLLKELSTMKGIKTGSLEEVQSSLLDKYSLQGVTDNNLFKHYSSKEIKGALWSPELKAADGADIPDLSDANYDRYIVDETGHFAYIKNRLYVSISMLPHLQYQQQGVEQYLYTKPSQVDSQWSIGQTIKFKVGDTDDDVINGVVVSLNGTFATIQLDAVQGIPFYDKGLVKMLPPDTTSVTNIDDKDLIGIRLSALRDRYPSAVIEKDSRLIDDPMAFFPAINKPSFVVTEQKTHFIEPSNKTSKDSISSSQLSTQTTFSAHKQFIEEKLKKLSNESSIDYKNVYAFPKIKIPITSYTIANGQLKETPPNRSSFMPPVLFQSLNKLVVDQMIDVSLGAAPVNEIPDGAILSTSNAALVAKTSGGRKTFVGFIDVGFTENAANLIPTTNDLYKSFASCMVNVGNQYLNVAKYFKDLNYVDMKNYDSEIEILNKSARKGSSLNMYYKEDSTDKMVRKLISPAEEPSIMTEIKSKFTPYGSNMVGLGSIVFEDGLLAYRISEEGQVPIYALLSHSKNAVVGDLSNIDFFDDKVLEDSILDKTTELTTAGFQMLSNADSLREAFEEEFADAFKGDLLTLLRLIFFCILSWLLVSSWICYGLMFSRARGILEMIKYPTGENNKRGFDVIQIFSLNTLNLESEFTLGRFIIYDIIISVLLMLVWKL